jgi:hypothetical protein
MPFMFTIDLRIICWGLDSLFLLKSVPFSDTESKLPCTQLQRWFSLRSDPASHIVYNFILSPKVPVCVSHLGNIVSHVFEYLRKTKGPNNIFTDKSCYPSAKRRPIPYTSTEEARQGNTMRPLQSSTSFRKPATVYRKLQCKNPSSDRHRSKINPRTSLH